MAELRTFLIDMINPEVMSTMISAELPKKLRARGYMKVNTTLSGRAGDTITIPMYKYIGEALDLAEGVAGVPVKMETEDVSYTVKKAAQFVTLTDESVLSGYGDPVGEVTRQLRMSVEDKIDSDSMTVLTALPATREVVGTGALDFDLVCKGVDLLDLDEPGANLTLLVPSVGLTQLRKDERFNDGGALADNLTVTGAVGAIGGCRVVKWKKIPDGVAYILKSDALTIFIKRNAAIETGRDILSKTTTFSVDQHFLVAIEDEAKIVRLKYTVA